MDRQPDRTTALRRGNMSNTGKDLPQDARWGGTLTNSAQNIATLRCLLRSLPLIQCLCYQSDSTQKRNHSTGILFV